MRHHRFAANGSGARPTAASSMASCVIEHVLDFSEEGGRLIASKVRDRRPIDAVYGILAVPDGTDAMLDELRGPPDLR